MTETWAKDANKAVFILEDVLKDLKHKQKYSFCGDYINLIDKVEQAITLLVG